jgi:uncharacterized protein YgiM (DUF1202 family)
MKRLLFVLCCLFLVNCAKNKSVEQLSAEKSSEEIVFAKTTDGETNNNIVYDYNNGNGTILAMKNEDGANWTYRKFNDTQEAWGGGKYNKVYNNPGLNNRKELFTLDQGEEFDIYEIATDEINGKANLWVKIKNKESLEGWIYGGEKDPYRDGNGAVLDIINIGDRTWTVKKLPEQKLMAENNLNVRDKPGLINTKVLLQIKKEDYNNENWPDYLVNYACNVTLLAITNEKDTIDEKEEYWVKIKDDKGREGWVFGKYLDFDGRGGLKYNRAETDVTSNFIPW